MDTFIQIIQTGTSNNKEKLRTLATEFGAKKNQLLMRDELVERLETHIKAGLEAANRNNQRITQKLQEMEAQQRSSLFNNLEMKQKPFSISMRDIDRKVSNEAERLEKKSCGLAERISRRNESSERERERNDE